MRLDISFDQRGQRIEHRRGDRQGHDNDENGHQGVEHEASSRPHIASSQLIASGSG